AVDLRIPRIDQPELAFELRLLDVAEYGAADRALARAGADQCDRTGCQQIFQTIDRHWFRYLGEAPALFRARQHFGAMCPWDVTRRILHPMTSLSLCPTAYPLLRQIKARPVT